MPHCRREVTFDPATQLDEGTSIRDDEEMTDMNDENVHTWTVEVLIGERDGQTHAEARLRTRDVTGP